MHFHLYKLKCWTSCEARDAISWITVLMLLFHGLWSLLMTRLSLLRHVVVKRLWFWPSHRDFQSACFLSFAIVHGVRGLKLLDRDRSLKGGKKFKKQLLSAMINCAAVCSFIYFLADAFKVQKVLGLMEFGFYL